MEQQEHIEDNIDPSRIASYLRSKLANQKPHPSSRCCIFRIPTTLRRDKEHFYQPNLVSIGPYHHAKNDSLMKPMEDIKIWYMESLLARAPPGNSILETMAEKIGEKSQDILDSYEEKQDLPTKEKLVQMMVLDGCFLIEYLRKYANIVKPNDDDPLFNKPWMRKVLVVDLHLLENQLPWFVLETLYHLSTFQNRNEYYNFPIPTLLQLAHKCFYRETLREFIIEELNVQKLGEIKHLLDLQRKIILYNSDDYYITINGNSVYEVEKHYSISAASELLQAGVKFQVREWKNDLTNIDFDDGVLRIPRVQFLDNTKSFLRNLIAYEQCDRTLGDRITSYALFMHELIESNQDLEKLQEFDIFAFYLSSDDVSGFFKSFYRHPHVVNYTYSGVSRRIWEHRRKFVARLLVSLRRDYFSNPWSVISVLAAFVALWLTFLQTYYTIKN